MLAINLKSAFFGTQLAAKQMIAQGGGGRIINMTSVHEDWPMPGNTPYCLSKGGMRMLTRTAGVELAPHNVLVVVWAPVRWPRRSTRDDERPGCLGQAQRRHPDRPHGPTRGDRLGGRLPGRRRCRLLAATTIFADGGIMQSSPGLSTRQLHLRRPAGRVRRAGGEAQVSTGVDGAGGGLSRRPVRQPWLRLHRPRHPEALAEDVVAPGLVDEDDGKKMTATTVITLSV